MDRVPKEPQPLFRILTQLYTTLLAGAIRIKSGVTLADPSISNPTRFYISIEYKNSDAARSLEKSWHAWERSKLKHEEPIEILVGCSQEDTGLDPIRAYGDWVGQGHRQLLAEQVASTSASHRLVDLQRRYDPKRHRLLAEPLLIHRSCWKSFEGGSRLKTAVRGWVAQHHLHGLIDPGYSDVSTCKAIEEDGKPDFRVTLGDGSSNSCSV